jgi:hypothetical protein
LRSRGTCPECGRDDILVNGDGILRMHRDRAGYGNCPGAHEPPQGAVIAGEPALAEPDAAHAAIARVRALHVRDHHKKPFCEECDRVWPCPTIRALEGEQ